MEADFGGWATKVGLKCSDGRTITRGAFEHMHNQTVPLIWQHGHNSSSNVLGHAVLEHRDEGVYAHAFFNATKQGQDAKELVEHKDIKFLSIYANQLVEKSKNVIHGMIREVSLVLAGANPGAVIDFVRLQHSNEPDDFTELEDEAVIRTGLELELLHADEDSDEDDEEDDEDSDTDDSEDDEDNEDEEVSHADDPTVGDVYEELTDVQKTAVDYIIAKAVEDVIESSKSAAHSEDDSETLTHTEGGGTMPRNVFDQDVENKKKTEKTLSHSEIKDIFADAAKTGSLKEAAENAVIKHGIENIDVLFPDAKAATGTIELEKRRTEWVSTVLNSTRHTPFSRIKTFAADLTQDEARAKGYIKGNYKLEEWFGVTKRKTGPTTIYKKQKIDRDDLLDITDFDVVSFLKAEMRLMTEEEFARAILIGDGRSPVDEDKIKDPLGAADGDGIRSVLNDHELFVTTLTVNVDDANSDYEEVVEAVMDGMEFYKGTGTPTFFTTIPHLNKFLKARDKMGRRFYENKQAVADALGVKQIITVEPMKEIGDLIGIIVNLDDYNVGTDRGGELTMFDDFDIDYNQYKYLLETRASGALVRPKSALVIKKTAAANVLVAPTKPAFNKSTGVVTIPTKTGVVYKDGAGTTLTAGDQTALAKGASTTVYATAASGYYFANTAEDSWPFTRPADN